MDNYMKLEFPAKSANESFARAAVAAFAAQLDINVEEMADIKTAVSEAVTNAIVHGYRDVRGTVNIHCKIEGNSLHITVEDFGAGIENVEQAKQPLFTTGSEEERSGMGFTVMETFMDELCVESALDIGTKVHMVKIIGKGVSAEQNDD